MYKPSLTSYTMAYRAYDDVNAYCGNSSEDEEGAWVETSTFLDQQEWETYMLDHSRFLWESIKSYIQDYDLPLLERCSFETFVDFLFQHSSKKVV